MFGWVAAGKEFWIQTRHDQSSHNNCGNLRLALLVQEFRGLAKQGLSQDVLMAHTSALRELSAVVWPSFRQRLTFSVVSGLLRSLWQLAAMKEPQSQKQKWFWSCQQNLVRRNQVFISVLNVVFNTWRNSRIPQPSCFD